MTELSTPVKASILREVADLAHPKLHLPNIAYHHDLTLVDLQALLQKHGWPRPDSMRRAAQLLEDTADETPERPRGVTLVSEPEPEVVAPAPTTTAVPVAKITASHADILEQAAESSKARTRNMAEKVKTLLVDLRNALEVEAGEAEARAEVERLREQLRQAEAKLRGDRPAKKKTSTPSAVAAGGDFACPVDGCGKTFPSKQGITMHNTRVHRQAAAS